MEMQLAYNKRPHNDRTVPDTIKSAVFGELVKLATPYIKHFHGDLYHDAQWVKMLGTDDDYSDNAANEDYTYQHWNWYYSADECGTWMSADKEVGLYRTRTGKGWAVTLTYDQGKWLFAINAANTQGVTNDA